MVIRKLPPFCLPAICLVSLYFNIRHASLSDWSTVSTKIKTQLPNKESNVTRFVKGIHSSTVNANTETTDDIARTLKLKTDPEKSKAQKTSIGVENNHTITGHNITKDDTDNDYPNCSVGYGNWPNGSRPLVGLTSFPRSGNTWTRHLIETATGIHTGSLYNANGLYNGGFTAEFDDPSLGRAVVYKAHGYADIFESGILLIRNPYDSFVSFYLFHTKGFMANPPLEEVFKDNKNWTNFVKRQHVRWPRIVENWFESGKRVLIVHYEDLVANTIYHLRRMLEFQNITLTPDRLKCLNDDLEGRFHRQHSENFHFDPYNEELHHIIDADIQKVNSLLKSRNEPPVHKAAYDVEL